MTDWVMAVERAYVAAATGGAAPAGGDGDLATALAALGAVASRYLAVGTPRTLGAIVATAADLPLARRSLEAHATWFQPREVRIAVLDGPAIAGEPGLRATPVAEALACDIVCVHAPRVLRAAELRRGTHVNVLAPCELDDDLRRLATVTQELPGLGELAAGLVDGRQLDELTVFVAGDAAIARRALPR